MILSLFTRVKVVLMNQMTTRLRQNQVGQSHLIPALGMCFQTLVKFSNDCKKLMCWVGFALECGYQGNWGMGWEVWEGIGCIIFVDHPR